MAKTRVHTISIPCMELLAAHLFSKTLIYIKSSLKTNVNDIIAFSDSKIKLTWLAKPGYNWNVFVANRVAEIQLKTPKVE